MAKTDNLTDFLTGVAGAIRTKKGTTVLINPQDFESEIGSIDTAKPEQTKTLTVTENGTQTVKPDTGKVLSGVTVTTNVPLTPTEEKTVDLSMTSGNQVITPTSGKVISKATIKKPATMIPANIRKDVNIGGVVGTMVEEHHTEQEKTADLNMASGNQIVNADSGKVMTRVTITKPTSMVASNIRKGTDIGGVVGSLEGKLPEEEKTVTITENGTTEVNATEGKAMTKVVVTTNVPIDNNKMRQIVDGTITELTVTDLSGITLIRGSAFLNCRALTKIEIPDSVTQINSRAFSGCTNLTSIIIPDSVTSFGDYYVVSNRDDGGSIFYDCSNLVSIDLPDSIRHMGNYIFYRCKNLTHVKLPTNPDLVDSGNSLFEECSSLKEVVFPENIESIGASVFSNCRSLEMVTIGSKVRDIGYYFLGKNPNKTTYKILAQTPPSLNASAFNGYTTYLKKIIVPKGTGDTYKAATNWSAVADYIEEAAE